MRLRSKLTATILVAAMAMSSLVGCGSKNNTTNDTNQTQAAKLDSSMTTENLLKSSEEAYKDIKSFSMPGSITINLEPTDYNQKITSDLTFDVKYNNNVGVATVMGNMTSEGETESVEQTVYFQVDEKAGEVIYYQQDSETKEWTKNSYELSNEVIEGPDEAAQKLINKYKDAFYKLPVTIENDTYVIKKNFGLLDAFKTLMQDIEAVEPISVDEDTDSYDMSELILSMIETYLTGIDTDVKLVFNADKQFTGFTMDFKVNNTEIGLKGNVTINLNVKDINKTATVTIPEDIVKNAKEPDADFFDDLTF